MNVAPRPAWPSPTDAWGEDDYIAMALVQRLRENSIPPDDAKAWTRILCCAVWTSREPPPIDPVPCPDVTPIPWVVAVLAFLFSLRHG